MVFVNHNPIKPDLIGDLILVVIPIVEVTGQLGVKMCIRQGEAKGWILLLQSRVITSIRLLGKIVELGLCHIGLLFSWSWSFRL